MGRFPPSRIPGLLPIAAGVLFVCGAALADPLPLRGVLGADPAWLFGQELSGDSTAIGWRREGWLGVRRPVRFEAASEVAIVSPCMRMGGAAEVCGGLVQSRVRASLGGRGWSFSDAGDGETAGTASMALGDSSLRMRYWLEDGDRRLASGVVARWSGERLVVSAGAQRTRGVASLHVWADEGSLELDWSARTDSVGVALAIPLGAWQLGGSWWRSRRDGGTSESDHLVDTTFASGWGVEGRRNLPAGSLAIHLWREDRQGVVEGHRAGTIFLEQVLESSRAALGMSLHGGPWGLSLETRQWSLRAPQGGLDHPSLHWNRLAQGGFAPYTSLLEDRRDFTHGTFSVQTWDAEFERGFRRGAWAMVPRWRIRWIGLDADIQRIRLVVKTFLPSTRQDTLAMGSGWILETGPRLEVRRDAPLGRIAGWMGIRVPVAGRWTASRPPAAPAATTKEPPASPVDPLGNWEAGGSWKF